MDWGWAAVNTRESDTPLVAGDPKNARSCRAPTSRVPRRRVSPSPQPATLPDDTGPLLEQALAHLKDPLYIGFSSTLLAAIQAHSDMAAAAAIQQIAVANNIPASSIGEVNMTLSPEAILVLMAQCWPENVRQLQNFVPYTLSGRRGRREEIGAPLLPTVEPPRAARPFHLGPQPSPATEPCAPNPSIQAGAENMAVIERTVSLSKSGSGANRFHHVVFGALHRVAQGEAKRDAGSDGGGQGAAGAVRRFGGDARVLETRGFAVSGAQQIDNRVAW